MQHGLNLLSSCKAQAANMSDWTSRIVSCKAQDFNWHCM